MRKLRASEGRETERGGNKICKLSELVRGKRVAREGVDGSSESLELSSDLGVVVFMDRSERCDVGDTSKSEMRKFRVARLAKSRSFSVLAIVSERNASRRDGQ
jgi:hypothetical protein